MATFFVKTSEGLLKVGGKVTMENIVTALGYVPADKAELDNYKSTLDNISSSADDALIVSDSSGNIIMRVDSNGLETTNVKSSYSVETEILTTNIINSGNDNFVLADASNNIIMRVDSNGLETTNVKTDTSEIGLLQANTINADNIENSGEFYVISDIDGNIIVKIDALGLHTTNVDADSVSVDTIDLTNAEIDNLTAVKAIVAGLAAANIEANTIIADLIDAETANISSITSDSAIITSISSGTIDAGVLTTGSISSSDSVFALSDESGDMILKVDSNGLETTTVTADKFVGDLEGNVTGNASTSYVASKVSNKLSINTSHGENIEFDGSSEKSITITAASLGLTQSMLYVGTSTTEITDGGNQFPTINGETLTPSNGNVVIYDNKEFIYNGSSWELFGDEMNHKVLQSPISDPVANGEKTTEFISNITQDANGNIIAIKKTIDNDVIESSLITVDTLVANNIHNTGDNYVISDDSGRMIMQVDANGVKTTNVHTTEDVTIEGDLTVDGNITGKLTGNVTGNLTGTASLAEALVSSADAGSASVPVYFKNGKPVQTDTTLNVSITGNAGTATTATNLAAKPELKASGNNITVTAGGKTSDSFAVPFATNAANATNSSLADALTSNAGSTNKPIYFDSGKPVECKGPIQLDVNAGTVTAAEKVVTPLIEHDGSEYAFADKDGNMLVKFSSDGITTTKVTADDKFVGNLEGNADRATNASLADALTSNAGSASVPVYFKNGIPTEVSGIDWNIVSGKPTTVYTTDAGKHNHTGMPTGNVTSTFEGAEFNTSEADNHKHSVTISGDVTSEFTAQPHSHTFTDTVGHTHNFNITVEGGETSVSGEVNSTFNDTVGHTHTITDKTAAAGGHTHTITANAVDDHTHNIDITGNVTLSAEANNGILTITASLACNSTTAAAGGHTHTITANAVDDHTHNINVTSNKSNVQGEVISEFSGSITIDLGASSGETTLAYVNGNISDTTVTGNVASSVNITADTTDAGKHKHTGMPTGNIISTFEGIEFNTSEADNHKHSVSLSSAVPLA